MQARILGYTVICLFNLQLNIMYIFMSCRTVLFLIPDQVVFTCGLARNVRRTKRNLPGKMQL